MSYFRCPKSLSDVGFCDSHFQESYNAKGAGSNEPAPFVNISTVPIVFPCYLQFFDKHLSAN